MDIEVTVRKKLVQVSFPENVDYHKLALKLGVKDATAWHWIKTGNIPEKYLDTLREIPLKDVKK